MALPDNVGDREYQKFGQDNLAAPSNPLGIFSIGKYTASDPVYADGDAVVQSYDSAGKVRVDTKQYQEGDTAATITGMATMWEDTSDTLRVASKSKPLPVTVINDLMLSVPLGEVTTRSSVNKFGRNLTIAANTTEDIWDGSALYSFPATASIKSISQTTDQAALQGGTIEVQGLDSNWDLVVQTVDLDASDTTTPVSLTTPLLRVFRMKVLENVIGSSDIRAHNTAETQDYAIITAGNNQTAMAIYTVPNAKTAYMVKWYATVNPATNLDPTSMPIRLWARDNENNYERQLKHVEGLTSGSIQHEFKPYEKFTQKTDIYLDASPVGKAADVSAGFDLIIIDN